LQCIRDRIWVISKERALFFGVCLPRSKNPSAHYHLEMINNRNASFPAFCWVLAQRAIGKPFMLGHSILALPRASFRTRSKTALEGRDFRHPIMVPGRRHGAECSCGQPIEWLFFSHKFEFARQG
jgi:hypothetical protein